MWYIITKVWTWKETNKDLACGKEDELEARSFLNYIFLFLLVIIFFFKAKSIVQQFNQRDRNSTRRPKPLKKKTANQNNSELDCGCLFPSLFRTFLSFFLDVRSRFWWLKRSTFIRRLASSSQSRQWLSKVIRKHDFSGSTQTQKL